ncbi:flagellar hook-length control protein FliK [Rhodanobacter lindaniclasticus]|uniref:flagellar hook-length control protein FliK n=1 Tax=Rhodanobacter lindaniclasticus TaxID=75310 RepID=UPI00109FFB08|nr:flagellar hook-length control protein FliK [Rhodanobacter lindaniclasticus]
MTASHVGSLSASTVAAKAVANTSTSESPGAAPFHQRLQDARGQGVSSARDAHDARPQHGPDPGRDRRDDPSPKGPNAQLASATDRLDPSREATTPPPAADAAAPAMPVAAPPSSHEAIADVATAEPPARGKDDDADAGAPALVEAMLALIAPAPVHPAAPVGGAASGIVDATAARLAAAQPGLAALGQAGATAVPVTPAIDPAVMAAATATPAAELLKLDPDATRETARLEVAPSVAPAVAHAAAAMTPAAAPVPVAPAHAFAQELGQQLAWFVGHDVKQARIRLHPEELGSLDLKISVQHNRVDVVLQAQHPGAVTAVQQALPQLDQMLARHGLSLGHADVGQHDRGGQAGHRGQGDEIAAIDDVAGPGQIVPLAQVGLVDAFA